MKSNKEKGAPVPVDSETRSSRVDTEEFVQPEAEILIPEGDKESFREKGSRVMREALVTGRKKAGGAVKRMFGFAGRGMEKGVGKVGDVMIGTDEIYGVMDLAEGGVNLTTSGVRAGGRLLERGTIASGDLFFGTEKRKGVIDIPRVAADKFDRGVTDRVRESISNVDQSILRFEDRVIDAGTNFFKKIMETGKAKEMEPSNKELMEKIIANQEELKELHREFIDIKRREVESRLEMFSMASIRKEYSSMEDLNAVLDRIAKDSQGVSSSDAVKIRGSQNTVKGEVVRSTVVDGKIYSIHKEIDSESGQFFLKAYETGIAPDGVGTEQKQGRFEQLLDEGIKYKYESDRKLRKALREVAMVDQGLTKREVKKVRKSADVEESPALQKVEVDGYPCTIHKIIDKKTGRYMLDFKKIPGAARVERRKKKEKKGEGQAEEGYSEQFAELLHDNIKFEYNTQEELIDDLRELAIEDQRLALNELMKIRKSTNTETSSALQKVEVDGYPCTIHKVTEKRTGNYMLSFKRVPGAKRSEKKSEVEVVSQEDSAESGMDVDAGVGSNKDEVLESDFEKDREGIKLAIAFRRDIKDSYATLKELDRDMEDAIKDVLGIDLAGYRALAGEIMMMKGKKTEVKLKDTELEGRPREVVHIVDDATGRGTVVIRARKVVSGESKMTGIDDAGKVEKSKAEKKLESQENANKMEQMFNAQLKDSYEKIEDLDAVVAGIVKDVMGLNPKRYDQLVDKIYKSKNKERGALLKEIKVGAETYMFGRIDDTESGQGVFVAELKKEPPTDSEEIEEPQDTVSAVDDAGIDSVVDDAESKEPAKELSKEEKVELVRGYLQESLKGLSDLKSLRVKLPEVRRNMNVMVAGGWRAIGEGEVARIDVGGEIVILKKERAKSRKDFELKFVTLRDSFNPTEKKMREEIKRSYDSFEEFDAHIGRIIQETLGVDLDEYKAHASDIYNNLDRNDWRRMRIKDVQIADTAETLFRVENIETGDTIFVPRTKSGAGRGVESSSGSVSQQEKVRFEANGTQIKSMMTHGIKDSYEDMDAFNVDHNRVESDAKVAGIDFMVGLDLKFKNDFLGGLEDENRKEIPIKEVRVGTQLLEVFQIKDTSTGGSVISVRSKGEVGNAEAEQGEGVEEKIEKAKEMMVKKMKSKYASQESFRKVVDGILKEALGIDRELNEQLLSSFEANEIVTDEMAIKKVVVEGQAFDVVLEKNPSTDEVVIAAYPEEVEAGEDEDRGKSIETPEGAQGEVETPVSEEGESKEGVSVERLVAERIRDSYKNKKALQAHVRLVALEALGMEESAYTKQMQELFEHRDDLEPTVLKQVAVRKNVFNIVKAQDPASGKYYLSVEQPKK